MIDLSVILRLRAAMVEQGCDCGENLTIAVAEDAENHYFHVQVHHAEGCAFIRYVNRVNAAKTN